MLEAQLSGRRVVITGGCGFIGGHLTDQVLRMPGTKVTVIDDCRYGTHVVIDAGDRYKLIRHRLGPGSLETLRKLIDQDDIVFHLAAEKLHQSHENQVGLLNSNVHGTWCVLEAAGRARAARVILASSLYAHGRMAGLPLREDDLPEPRTVYGVTKLAGEYLLQTARHQRRLRGLALRFFFVYGPRQFSSSGYPSVIVKNFQRLAKGERPTICGDGKQALDYVYIDDAVRALVLAATSDLDGEVLHIGSGHAVSILELTRQMQKVAGTSLSPKFIEKDFTAGSHRETDTEKARKKLGFTSDISLEDGLAATWSWLTKEGTA